METTSQVQKEINQITQIVWKNPEYYLQSVQKWQEKIRLLRQGINVGIRGKCGFCHQFKLTENVSEYSNQSCDRCPLYQTFVCSERPRKYSASFAVESLFWRIENEAKTIEGKLVLAEQILAAILQYAPVESKSYESSWDVL